MSVQSPGGRQQSGEIPAQVEDGEVALYRFFDREDRLLYVGITEEPIKRWNAHASRKWWPSAARYRVEWYATRPKAERAEREAIVAERPQHNVVFNRDRKIEELPRSPVLTEIIVDEFRGETFTVDGVARRTGFSSTSASKTIRFLVATGQAVAVGAPKWSVPRSYQLTTPTE